MKIKKYVVADLKEAIQLIRKDLGDEAVIVNQQLVSAPGVFGFLKKKQLEVTAAVDGKGKAQKKEFRPTAHRRYEEQLNYNQPESFVNEMTFTSNDFQDLIKKIEQPEMVIKQEEADFKPGLVIKHQEESTSPKGESKQGLETELNEIKSMIEKITSNPSQIVDVNQQLSQAIATQLEEYDFSPEFATAWQQYLLEQKSENREVSPGALYEFVKHEVARLVCIGNDPEPKIQVFVGPPGVGKTTTIAKIASNELIYHQRKVGLITVDTYRIGAVEQLKTYASILNIPIKVAYNKEDMKQAIDELQDCDRIIIDSVGRTHRDQENLSELKALFEPLTQYNCYLVLSMSMKSRQLTRIMERYQYLNYNHLVLTKLDESERNENILNLCYGQTYPITYLCTGQEVPTDIEVPNFNRILELIWGGEYHG